MGKDFVTALKEEIAGLRAEMERDVRFQRLRELERVLRLYEPDAATGGGAEPTATVARTLPAEQLLGDGVASANFAPRLQSAQQRERAVRAARMMLENRTGPVMTREIHEHLQSLGIKLGGKDPVNNLSSLLSRAEGIESHGRRGWTRKKPVKRVSAEEEEARIQADNEAAEAEQAATDNGA